jgi:hypothetical protein
MRVVSWCSAQAPEKAAKGGADAEDEMDPTQYFENRTKMLAKFAETSGGRDAIYPHKFHIGSCCGSCVLGPFSHLPFRIKAQTS